MGSIRLLRLLLERGQYPWHRPMVLKLATPRQVHGRAVGRDQVGDLAGLPPLREADVCESTGHKNAQPTRPERNAQPADLHRPSKDDPQQMYYCHDEKQRGGDHHIGFSVQSAYPSASRPTTLTITYGYELFDASLPSGLARWRGHRRPSASPLALPSMHADWS